MLLFCPGLGCTLKMSKMYAFCLIHLVRNVFARSSCEPLRGGTVKGIMSSAGSTSVTDDNASPTRSLSLESNEVSEQEVAKKDNAIEDDIDKACEETKTQSVSPKTPSNDDSSMLPTAKTAPKEAETPLPTQPTKKASEPTETEPEIAKANKETPSEEKLVAGTSKVEEPDVPGTSSSNQETTVVSTASESGNQDTSTDNGTKESKIAPAQTNSSSVSSQLTTNNGSGSPPAIKNEPADAGVKIEPADAGAKNEPADAGAKIEPADSGVKIEPADAGVPPSTQPPPTEKASRPELVTAKEEQTSDGKNEGMILDAVVVTDMDTASDVPVQEAMVVAISPPSSASATTSLEATVDGSSDTQVSTRCTTPSRRRTSPLSCTHAQFITTINF